MRKVTLASFLVLCLPLIASAKEPSQIERGKYLVSIMVCNDCHSPTLPGTGGALVADPTRLLSGHPQDLPYPTWSPADLEHRHSSGLAGPMLTAWAGPWGVSFAANLTPDKETGIGEWSEKMFIQMMRTGKHQGQPNGRDILPPMPWQWYRHASDADLKAVWAYLRSLPPVSNRVPFPLPPGATAEGQAGR